MNNNLNKATVNQELILTIQNLVLKECNKENNRQIEMVSNNAMQNVTEYNDQDVSCDICKCLGNIVTSCCDFLIWLFD